MTQEQKHEAIIEFYEEMLSDHRRLVRELDKIINGKNAAEQASLCDIVAQLTKEYKPAPSKDEPGMRWRKCKGNYPSKEGCVCGRNEDPYNPGQYHYFEYYFSGDKELWDRHYQHSEWLDEGEDTGK